MATKSLGRSFKMKDGKLVRVTTFRAGIKKRNAAHTAKRWLARSSKRQG